MVLCILIGIFSPWRNSQVQAVVVEKLVEQKTFAPVLVIYPFFKDALGKFVINFFVDKYE